jgi:hypothetical protein
MLRSLQMGKNVCAYVRCLDPSTIKLTFRTIYFYGGELLPDIKAFSAEPRHHPLKKIFLRVNKLALFDAMFNCAE